MSIPLAKETRIIIADDHPLFRSGIRAELERIENLTLVGECGDGEEALTMILELNPDLAILDVNMPKLTGLDVTQKLCESECKTRIILLTMHREKKLFLRALELGIIGYLLKDALVSEIQQAVFAVAGGSFYLSPDLSGLLVEQTRGSQLEPEWKLQLTPAELGIMTLIADLKSNDEIATNLFISKRTVENHRVNISRKLGISGTNALLKFAVKNKSLL